MPDTQVPGKRRVLRRKFLADAEPEEIDFGDIRINDLISLDDGDGLGGAEDGRDTYLVMGAPSGASGARQVEMVLLAGPKFEKQCQAEGMSVNA